MEKLKKKVPPIPSPRRPQPPIPETGKDESPKVPPPVQPRVNPPSVPPRENPPPVTTRNTPPVTTRNTPPVTTKNTPPVTTKNTPPVPSRNTPPVPSRNTRKSFNEVNNVGNVTLVLEEDFDSVSDDIRLLNVDLSSLISEIDDFEKEYVEDNSSLKLESIFNNLNDILKENDLSDLNVMEVDIDKLKI